MQMDRCMCFISCSFVNARSGRIQVSPALDLVKDYSRFVIEFFEVINISAPHIYHSALLLSPLMSIVRGLYKQYVRPFTRVVRGLPVSWEPISATLCIENFNGGAVWSPCGRFIAVAKSGSTEILDAVTLNPLSTLEPPPRFGVPVTVPQFYPGWPLLNAIFLLGDRQLGHPDGWSTWYWYRPIRVSLVFPVSLLVHVFYRWQDGRGCVRTPPGSQLLCCDLRSIRGAHAYSSYPKTHHTPDLDSRPMSPICHHETVIHHHMGSRVYLDTRASRSRVIACPSQDR